ncbi:MAG: SIS domain-containing protein [Endomicrobiaceae bacterium]|nr:SIS domain-containing protein [Endomicrobiaceae bacterium]MDD3922579.1 SIS domain-containing protein [Endomicrobiaceae bacterium]MDD5101562.1 SIS domain-containing protein [Endomicrobiaceae bacterium]
MDMERTIKTLISDSIETKQKMLDEGQLVYIQSIANKINEAYQHGKKTIIFGNGGSACDALHFAAELVCRFEKDRKALPSIALTENVSSLTAIGNDFGYDFVFSRQVEAFAQKGDIIIAITTSGNSINVIKAVETAKDMGIFVIGLTGADGGQLKMLSDMCYCAPSKVTGRIQECHILLLHIIAKLVEEKIFG